MKNFIETRLNFIKYYNSAFYNHKNLLRNMRVGRVIQWKVRF